MDVFLLDSMDELHKNFQLTIYGGCTTIRYILGTAPITMR